MAWFYVPGRSGLPICLVLVSVLAWPAAAAEDATVSGSLIANGETVELPYVYVYAEEQGFYDEGDPAWTLIFVDRPIAEREVDEPIWGAAYISLGITRSAEFDDEPALQVYSQSMRFSADQPGNVTGGSYPEIELESDDPERFVGRVYHAEEQKIFDDTFQYDFTFSASLSEPNAPLGAPLPADGGEPGKAYLTWVETLHSGDLERLKALLPPEMAEMLDRPEATEELEFMRALTPTNPKILGGSSDGSTAILQVEGIVEGEKVAGEVTLEWIEGRWQATATSW